MKSTSFKGLAKRVGKKLVGVLPEKRSNLKEQEVIVDNDPSERMILESVDSRQDPSVCHIKEEIEQQRTLVEDEAARKVTIMERVLAERHRIEDFSDPDDETSVELCSPDRKSSTMPQVMKRGDFSVMSGRTLASKGISVVRDDDIFSIYSGMTGTMPGYESDKAIDTDPTPTGLLDVLGTLMGFGTAPSGEDNSLGTEDSAFSTSHDSETDGEDNTTISQWSNSTQRSSRSLAKTTSSAGGLTIAEDQPAYGHQNRQKIVASRMSLQRIPEADEVSSAGVEVPLSQMIKFEGSSHLDLEDETKSRDVETLSITDNVQFPIFYRRIRSDEVTSVGIELPITELGKLHSARQHNKDAKVFDDAAVPIMGNREPHVGLPKTLKIPDKPAMELGSDEATSAGIEIPFTAFPRKPIPRYDPEEASSAGIEVDLASLPKESRNTTASTTSYVRLSISRDIVSKDTTMTKKVAQLSKKNTSSVPSLFDFFSSWTHSGLTCVHCKETFSVMDARSECHVGHPRTGVKGKVHAKCQSEYERVRKRYDKVVHQVALFALMRRKWAMKLEDEKNWSRGPVARENSTFWSHGQSDIKRHALQGTSRTTGRKVKSVTPSGGQSTVARQRSGTAPPSVALPVITRRGASTPLVNHHNADRAKATSSRQGSARDVAPILGRPTKSRAISTKQSPSLRRAVQPTPRQAPPSAKGCILPSNHRKRTNHRIIQDRDDVLVCPRYSSRHTPIDKSKPHNRYQQSDNQS